MDWKAVGKVIAPLAPALGSIVGGFIPIPGGSIIGQKAGELVARVFGVEPTPEAVNDAIKRMDHDLAIAKLQEATKLARAEVDGFIEAEKQYYETVRTGLEQAGLSMRVEVLPENRHWFFTGWRPACGWVFVVASIVFGCQLSVALARAAFLADPVALQVLTNAWPAFLAYLGPLALMVGVYVVARTADKSSGTATQAPASSASPAPKTKQPASGK